MAKEPAQIRFYTDKHIPKAVATQLRKHGVDIIRCEEVGLGDASDLVHLERATQERRVVITRDADFTRLHAEWQEAGRKHFGIMFCLSNVQGEVGIGKIVNIVLMYHELISGGAGTIEDDVANQVIFIS